MSPEEHRDEAYRKAFDSLGRYKFVMFGYWAATWVQMNKLCRFKEPNPFRGLIDFARTEEIHLTKEEK